jgi:hypothetical protein
MYRSREFYDFLRPLGTKFLPTSVGAPWTNSNAERSIKTIKQAMRNYSLQEKVEYKWDEYAIFSYICITDQLAYTDLHQSN